MNRNVTVMTWDLFHSNPNKFCRGIDRQVTTWLNQNFRILYIGNGKRTLIGAGTLSEYLNSDQILRLYNDLKRCQEYSYTYWNRSGIKIKFYSK